MNNGKVIVAVSRRLGEEAMPECLNTKEQLGYEVIVVSQELFWVVG